MGRLEEKFDDFCRWVHAHVSTWWWMRRNK